MTTPARAQEAGRAAVAMQIALAHLGASTIEEAVTFWLRMPTQPSAGQVEAWLDDVVETIVQHRAIGRDLALAFYRLTRALHTGRTVPRPGEPERTSVTLDQLRHEFRVLADGLAPTEEVSPEAQQLSDAQEARTYDWTNDGEDTEIPIDTDSGQALEEEPGRDAEVEEAAREVLEVVGPARLEQRLDAVDTERPAKDVDAERERAREFAALETAAAAAYAAKDAARRPILQSVGKDKRLIGYVRITDADPCSWCAMLASRGIDYRPYKSASTAGDEDEWHPNCNCEAVPVFSEEAYLNGDEFASARQFEAWWSEYKESDLYRQTTRPTSNDLLNGWRTFYDRKMRTARSQRQTAQEATAA